MVVYLARTSESEHSAKVYAQWLEIVEADEARAHRVTQSPDEADFTLIVDVDSHKDPASWALRTHPIWKGKRPILAYDERDWPRSPLAGLVVSLPRALHRPSIHRAAPYFRTMQRFEPSAHEPDLLFSFIGAPSHPMRERLFALQHPRAVVTRSGVNYFDPSPSAETLQKQSDQKAMFRDVMQRSKFVLCPRGEGLSSFRLYEVMSAGRVPVIVADGWMPPPQTDWEKFALFVAETDIERIPALLEEHEEQFATRSQAARAAFDEFYAPSKIFNHLVDLCGELLPLRRASAFYRFSPKIAARVLQRKLARQK